MANVQLRVISIVLWDYSWRLLWVTNLQYFATLLLTLKYCLLVYACLYRMILTLTEHDYPVYSNLWWPGSGSDNTTGQHNSFITFIFIPVISNLSVLLFKMCGVEGKAMSAIFVYCYLLGYQNICHRWLNAGIPARDMTFSPVCKKDFSAAIVYTRALVGNSFS